VPNHSLLIAVYNESEYIIELLDSIRSQPSSDLQILICDDGSTDNTPQLISSYQHNHPELDITFIASPRNCGKNSAYNKIFKYATGSYISLIGGDDIITHYRFSTPLSLLTSRKPYTLAYQPFNHKPLINHFLSPRTNSSCRCAPFSSPIHGGSIFLPYEIASSIFPLPTSLPSEDWPISFYLFQHSIDIASYPYPALLYRLHDSNDSASSGIKSLAKLKKAVNRQNIFLRYYLTLTSNPLTSLKLLYSIYSRKSALLPYPLFLLLSLFFLPLHLVFLPYNVHLIKLLLLRLFLPFR